MVVVKKSHHVHFQLSFFNNKEKAYQGRLKTIIKFPIKNIYYLKHCTINL